MRGETYRRLPVEPLTTLLAAIQGPPEGLKMTGGVTEGGATTRAGLQVLLGPGGARAYHRCKKQGWISWLMADRMAVALGFHPCEIWGWEWWAIPDNPGALYQNTRGVVPHYGVVAA